MLLVLAFVMEAFFFFQAEDGIRDFHVTGVQTCALPIFPCVLGVVGQVGGLLGEVGGERGDRVGVVLDGADAVPVGLHEVVELRGLVGGGLGVGEQRVQVGVGLLRSEERRVGKGGRASGQ